MSSGSERRNSLLRWGIAAFCTVILLAAILARNGYRNSSARWSSFLVGDPHEGALLFFEKKGCAGCHTVNGVGGKSAPDLGCSRSPQSGLSQSDSAPWNHAPTMWEGRRAKRGRYPDRDHEDVVKLFGYLY